MKSVRFSAGIIAAILTTLTLTGCGAMHRQHHPESTSLQGQRPITGGPQMGRMERPEMCDRYERMAAARTPEERMAMMDEHMKSMSPETRQRQMDMMQQQCKGARP